MITTLGFLFTCSQPDNSCPTHELHSSAESVNAPSKHMSDGQVEALPGPSFHTDGSRDGSEGNISPSVRRHGSVGESASELETNAESRPQNAASESSTDADTVSVQTLAFLLHALVTFRHRVTILSAHHIAPRLCLFALIGEETNSGVRDRMRRCGRNSRSAKQAL